MKNSFNVILNSSDLSSYQNVGSQHRYTTRFDNELLNKSYDVEVSFRSSQLVLDVQNIMVANINVTTQSNIIQNTNNSKMSCILDVVYTERGTDKHLAFIRTANHYNNTFRINNLTDIYCIDFGVKEFLPYNLNQDTGLNAGGLVTVDTINGDWFDFFDTRYICILKFTEV